MMASQKMLLFLGAALGILVLLGPKPANTQTLPTKNVQCTMGSCPTTITAAESGKTLVYPIGGTIEITEARSYPLIMNCDAPEMWRVLLDKNSSDLEHTSRLLALKRGTCRVEVGKSSFVLQVSRFR